MHINKNKRCIQIKYAYGTSEGIIHIKEELR